MADAVNYASYGLCPPSGENDPLAYASYGLLFVAAGLTPGKGTIETDGTPRDRFARRARREAEFLHLLLLVVAAINEDDD